MKEILLTLLGTVLPCALVLWLTQRGWRIPAYITVTTATLVALFCGSFLIRQVLPVPVDEVVRGYPYRGVVGEVSPLNPLTNDTVKQMLPWMQAAREQLAAGQVPLWNPYSFAGYPLLANAQSAPFSPFFLFTLLVPLPKQIVAMAALKLLVALTFGFLLAREEGLSDWPALTSSIIFAFSAFQIVYLYYPLASVTALLPALLFGLARTLRFNRDGFFIIAIVQAAMLASGHPESVIHAQIAAALYVLIRGGLRPKKAWAVAIAASLLGLLLAAPAWLPFADYVRHTERYEQIVRIGRHMTPAYPTGAAWTLLNPDSFGNPAQGTWHGPMNYSMIASSYAGLLALAAVVATLLGRRTPVTDRVLAVAAVLCYLLAFNWTPLAHLLNHLPPLNLVANDRLRFVGVLFAGLLTGHALERSDRRDIVFAATTAIVAVASWWLWAHRPVTVRRSPELASVAALIGIGMMLMMRKRSTMRQAGIAGLVAADLIVLLYPFNAPAEQRYFRPPLPILEQIKSRTHGEPFRVLGLDWVFLPSASGQYDLEDIRGTDPMGFAEYQAALRTVADPSSYRDVLRITDPTSPLIDFLNVRFLLTEPNAPVGAPWQRIYTGADGDLFENQRVVDRFFIPRDCIAMRTDWTTQLRELGDARTVLADCPPKSNAQVSGTEERPGRFIINVNAAAQALVATSVPAVPGWKLTLNGQRHRLRRVNGAFLAFEAPAGATTFTLDYAPRSFTAGCIAGALGAIALTFALWGARYRASSVSE